MNLFYCFAFLMFRSSACVSSSTVSTNHRPSCTISFSFFCVAWDYLIVHDGSYCSFAFTFVPSQSWWNVKVYHKTYSERNYQWLAWLIILVWWTIRGFIVHLFLLFRILIHPICLAELLMHYFVPFFAAHLFSIYILLLL